MDSKGLTKAEVAERVSSGKVNSVESKVSRSYLDIVIKNVCTVFNLVLLIIGLALIACDEPISAASATGIIAINILVSTIQEMRAKRRLDKIALLLRPTVRIVRDGEEIECDPSKIVMDDIIHMVSGYQAQVDGVLIESKMLEMDESLLTGESSTRRKRVDDTIYSGSFCISGEGYYRVTALGKDTFASEMLNTAKKFKNKKTPLQMETSTITSLLIGVAFAFFVTSLIVNVLFSRWIDLTKFLHDCVIIIDIVPIALFLLVTITYMIAAVRMANSGVLLQNFNSVESMSHVDTVCMDKTGTITTNNLVYEEIECFIDESVAEDLIRDIISATNSKNRTVHALVRRFGSNEVDLIDEVQFSSDRKFSSVKVRKENGIETIFMGAWTSFRGNIDLDEGDISDRISKLSKRGLRSVLICTGGDVDLYDGDNAIIPKLKVIAIAAIRDEVRPDCKEIINEFISNGMDVKVISGDDPETVDAIFTLAEIPGRRNLVSGDELRDMDPETYESTVLSTNIFGRMKPDQKEDVIETLKRNGRYVAMVGDGVNDVRSLKAARVGVALQSGSGAARGVSDMVLMDDRFSALPKAITEGKRTVTGMRDILRLYLTRNFVLAIVVFVLLIVMGRLPMLPVQNAYYAFVTVSIVAFLMSIWAQPSDNNKLVLPDVLKHCIPYAITISILALMVYLVFAVCTNEGYFPLGKSFYESMFYNVYLPSDPGFIGGFDDFMADKMKMIGEDYGEITARTAMVMFLVLAGIMQIFVMYPKLKIYSNDGKTSPQWKPTILGLLLIGLVILMHNIPIVAIGFVSLAIFPLEYYILIAGFVATMVLFSRYIAKSRIVHIIEEKVERKYTEKLYAEYKKEDIQKEEDQKT